MGYAGSGRGLVNLHGLSGIILAVFIYLRWNNGSYLRSTLISLAGIAAFSFSPSQRSEPPS